MLDEEARQRIEAETIARVGAEHWTLIRDTVRALDPTFPSDDGELLVRDDVDQAPGPRLLWQVDGRVYAVLSEEPLRVLESGRGRARLLGPGGAVLDEVAIVVPALN